MTTPLSELLFLKPKEAQIKPQYTPPPSPTKTDILLELWKDFKELDVIRKDIKNETTKLTPPLKEQIYIFQVKSQTAKVMLQALPQQIEMKATMDETINVITTDSEDAILSQAARILERKTKPTSLH